MHEPIDGHPAPMPRDAGGASHTPRSVRLLDPLVRTLLSRGVPMGPNQFVTIRGRTSGLPRSTPLAIIELSGRRWIWSPWGEVHWVRNLRAAGRATIQRGRRTEEVAATELTPTERIGFFRDILGHLARTAPGGYAFFRIVDGVDLHDPVATAEGRAVFELFPLPH